MDIIYKFTSNATGRFYIGSKTECEIVDGKIFSREGITYLLKKIGWPLKIILEPPKILLTI